MLFNSLVFLVFYLITLAVYYFANQRIRPIILLIASYIFYSYSNIYNLLVLIIATVISYSVGLSLSNKKNKYQLVLGIILNLGLLGYFKYRNFFLDMLTVSGISSGHSLYAKLLLPLGISFYIFQAISYLVDVYNKKVIAEKSYINLALYLAFFPKILAGPIERAASFLPQINSPSIINNEKTLIGLKTILWGFFCKLIVADKLSFIVSQIYENNEKHCGITLLIGLILYSFQIYFDFQGYTQIAIGTAKIFGIELTENFKQPYLSKSIKEFWHRWHITLSNWVRDYLYIPLGGNSISDFRFAVNILLVFLLSGLWHGTSLNYLIWGSIHGAYYLIERFTEKPLRGLYNLLRISNNSYLIKLAHNLIIFSSVTIAWLAFKIENIASLKEILMTILFRFHVSQNSWINEIFLKPETLFYMGILMVFYLLDSTRYINKYLQRMPTRITEYSSDLLLINVQLILLFLIGDIGSKEFIYFRF